jgi:hypothetical protein
MRTTAFAIALAMCGCTERAAENVPAAKPPSRGSAAPSRMASEPIARVRAAIAQRDAAALDDAFTALTATCNACHVAEKVAFIHVAPPTERHSPVTPAAPHPSPEKAL